jgi:hypothetical protein
MSTMIDRIQQLQEQLISATLCRAALEDAAFRNPEHGVVEAMLEARAAESACRAELQEALRAEMALLEEAA